MIYETMNGKNAGQTIKENQTWSKCRKWGAYPQLIYLQQPIHHKFRKHHTEVGWKGRASQRSRTAAVRLCSLQTTEKLYHEFSIVRLPKQDLRKDNEGSP